jgi:hypothetical protein
MPATTASTVTTPTNGHAWRERLAAIVALTVALLGLSSISTPSASAATAVTVNWGGICSVEYNIVNGLGFGSGVNFNLGSHSSRNLTLYTRYSWGWNRGQDGRALPSTWKNQYHVRFLDSSGRAVWTQYNSIPNGGSRSYYVGSNVRTIQVIAGIGLDAFGRARVPAVGPAVGYVS